jgi:hypothetical protein
MSLTFVNKNLLIPQIKEYSDFNPCIQQLMNTTFNMDKLYCSNVYIVSSECVYFSDGNNIYSVSNTNIIKKVDLNIPNKTCLTSINSFLNLEIINPNIDISQSNTVNNMDINIKIPKHKNIIIEDEDGDDNNKKNVKKEIKQTKKYEQPKPKTPEELEIIKLCEETMELYQTEVKKMKDIEQQIKVLDANKKSILKKRREKLFTNFSKLKNDYNTFNMINKKLDKKPEMEIPSLFALKYNYFEQIVKNSNYASILSQIDAMNLDEVLNKDYELNKEMEDFVNSYGDESKKLNIKFDHSWEELDLETEPIENNNSRLANI